MMELEYIKWETKDRIAIITLNRPKVLNALNRKAMAELDQVIMRIERDSKLMAAVITGSGSKAFSSGADIGEIWDLIPAESPSLARRGQAVLSRLEGMEKPVVAGINGFALGAGCELALACTFRVATETTKFGFPEIKRGIIPGYGGTQRLPRLIGKGRALEIILTGRMVDAWEAYQLGLVNKVVPEVQLMDASIQLLEEVLQNAPIAIRMALQSVNQGINMDLERGLAYEANLFGICFTTEDKQEGIRAFREKRPPQFKGR